MGTSFHYRKEELYVEDVSLASLAKKFGTPTYVYSKAAFLRPLRELQKGLEGLDSLVCFAVKANSNLSVLKLLGQYGAGMDIVSGGELERAHLASVQGSSIVFSGVGKTRAEIVRALELRVSSFHVESMAELQLIHQIARERKTVASVAFRFNPNVNAKTHPHISTGLKENKFGLDRAEVFTLISQLPKMPHVRLEGLSVHIGSQLLSLQPLSEAFQRLKNLAHEVEESIHRPLRYLDLGGGLGISYGKGGAPKIKAYTQLIQRHFLGHHWKILIEPGRTIAGNAGILLTEILFAKPRKSKNFIIVDAAMNDLLRPALYESFHEIVPTRKLRSPGRLRTVDVVGPVCETSDRLGARRALPESLASGDHLAVLSAGAYGFSMSSNYNSRPRPPEILVDGKTVHVIRPRETLKDLLNLELPRLKRGRS